jgi:hypothetical protein
MPAAKPITSYTLQEAFDAMVNHLRRQGKPSQMVIDDGRLVCAYRGDDGCACAVGALIPDDQYNPTLERHSLSSIYDELGFDVDDKLLDFLCDAQTNLHDSPARPTELDVRDFLDGMELGAIDLARSYDLSYTPPVGAPA